MRIEEGKFYRTRDGRKVGPMVVECRGVEWEFEAEVDGHRVIDGTYCAWRADGSFDPFDRKEPHRLDIISEWADEGPICTIQRIIPGTYDGVVVWTTDWKNRVRITINPTDMDHAALTRAAAVLTALAGALRDDR